MSSLLTLRQRMKSIKNTRQITKAMEKVSAIKMKKSQAAALRSRRYAALAHAIAGNLAASNAREPHPFLEDRPVQRVGYVVISSDRGLCGPLNLRLLQEFLRTVRAENRAPESVRLYTMGKRFRDAALRYGLTVHADFGGIPQHPTMKDARGVVRAVIDDYLSGAIDACYLLYTDFVNTLSQKPNLLRILPLSRDAEKGERVAVQQEYLFEPSPEEVLEALLLRVVELDVYQALLEHHASEHSARMVAMKNATENAGELIGNLGLVYNTIRQANITREIAEISAGRIALE